MRWCTVFYNVWRKERDVPRDYGYLFTFVRYFNEVCRRKRAEGRSLRGRTLMT